MGLDRCGVNVGTLCERIGHSVVGRDPTMGFPRIPEIRALQFSGKSQAEWNWPTSPFSNFINIICC